MSRVKIAASFAVPFLVTGCAGDNDNAACSEQLDKEQHEVATRAIEEVTTETGAIRFALEDRFSTKERRDIGRATQRLRRTADRLETAFSQACA